jgi:hypothetical protein
MLDLLSHLSYLSPIRSHTCPLAVPILHAGRATRVPGMTARPARWSAVQAQRALPASFPTPAPFPVPILISPPLPGNLPACPPIQAGVRPSPPRPCRACPWALPPLLTPRQPPLGGVWSQERQAQWRAVTPVRRSSPSPRNGSSPIGACPAD